MKKKDKYLELLLWGIVAYAVAILTYFTLKVFDQGVDSISAIGSLLSAAATFFAAFIAAYLFNDWKDQHNKIILAGEAKLAFSLLHDERNILHDMKYVLSKKLEQSPSEYLNLYDSNLSPLPDTLTNMVNTNRLKLAEFVFLIEGSQLHSDLNAYRESITLLNKDIAVWKSSFTTYKDVFEKYDSLIEESLRLNFIILQDLKSYILYKDKALT
ncbi:hypothetical protein [Acinetobacter sp. BSP-28]|uniref:hypothetical protein n=1 Tax=Acinetobacter sp. BSP-28 TaxID=3344661 RepID=UPI00376FAE6D